MTIEAINIGFIRADKYLFRNLNFNIGRGELLRIEGQNGAGKTTLLKIVSGLISPDKGHVTWQKSSIKASHDFKEQIAFLGHRDGINLNLTVMENMALQVHLSKAKINNQAITQLLDKLALTSKAHVPCSALSQGQRRKVAIGSLLLKNKSIWLLDEPFTSLDKTSIALFTESIQTHLGANGLVMIASHHPIDLAHKVVNL